MVKIAVDKNSFNKIKKINGVEYFYLFDKSENIKDLLETGLHCINYKNCEYVDINLTDYNVDCLKRTKVEEPDYYVLPEKIDFKIGIIIPNYNYAECLPKCIESILNQTYQNFEIIFIDDMSTDNSVEIMKEYQRKFKDKIKVVELKQKRFNGGARNEGYLYLSDDVDYVWYVDSDDWLYNEEALENINNKLQDKPDVLFIGMAHFIDNKLETCFIPEYENKYVAMEGWSGSCGKVIKKSLATRQECLYNEGTLKEDRNQHYKICINMKNFELLKKPVYVWNRMNSKSVTTIREKVFWGTSTIRHYADIMQIYLSEKGKDRILDGILEKRLKLAKKEIIDGGDRQW